MTNAFDVFERKVLVFPVAVVLFAMATFLFGGTMHPWHWWIPFAAVLFVDDWRNSVRARIAGSLGFLACAVAMWVFCGVSIAPGWVDEQWYQMPAVHMLAEGWNPLRERSPEALAQLFDLKIADCRMLHIVYAAKPVWIFNAAAWFFTHDMLNPLVPVLFFVTPGVCCRIFRSMKDCAWWWKAVAVGMLFCIAPNTPYVTDAVIAVAAIGLLLSFEEIIRGRDFDPMSLVVFSFWFLGAKTNGIVHGVFFWIVFVAWIAFRRREVLKRSVKCGMVAAALLLVANATPYLTSVIDYGHPLYPRYTVDEEKYPSADITEDFLTGRNEDASALSWCGQFVNAYISPVLVRSWYRWRLDRPDFQVRSANYSHYPNDSDGTYPTRFGMRFAFWFSLIAMVAVRPRSFGPIAFMVILGLALVPGQMMGYCRYISWWQSVTLFAFIAFVTDGSRKWRFVYCAMAALVALGLFSIRPWSLSRRIGYELSRFGERREFFRIIESDEVSRVRLFDNWTEAQIFFMRRRLPAMARLEILPVSNKIRKAVIREDIHLPGRFFVLENIALMREEKKRIQTRCGEKGVKRVLHSAFVALPKSVVDHFAGRTTSDKE